MLWILGLGGLLVAAVNGRSWWLGRRMSRAARRREAEAMREEHW